MKKFINLIAELPTWFFLFSPAICGFITRSHKHHDGGTGVVLAGEIFAVVYMAIFVRLLKPFSSETSSKMYQHVPTLLFNQLVFLVLLFIEVAICRIDTAVTQSNYYLPQVVFDFFAPDNTAVKLLTIAVLFLCLLPTFNKSKEYYPDIDL